MTSVLELIGASGAVQELIAALPASRVALGMWAPVLFVLAYGLSTLAFLPSLLFALAAGALFGPWLGGLYALTGAMLGALIAFGLARWLGGGWLPSNGRLARLAATVEAQGWRGVVIARQVPVPFALLNFGLGLTRLSYGQYVVPSVFCLAPASIVYAYLGWLGMRGLSGEAFPIHALLPAAGALLALILIPGFVRQFQRLPA